MATFNAVYEGKISIWNDKLNGSTNKKEFHTICYLFNNYPDKINLIDNSSFIMVHIPKTAIIGDDNTAITISFEAKNNKMIPFLVKKITVKDNVKFGIVIINKLNKELKKIDTTLLGSRLNDTDLRKILNSISSDEDINDTTSRPPCN